MSEANANEFVVLTQSNGKKTYVRKNVVTMIEPAVSGRGCVVYVGTGGDNIPVREGAEEVLAEASASETAQQLSPEQVKVCENVINFLDVLAEDYQMRKDLMSKIKFD